MVKVLACEADLQLEGIFQFVGDGVLDEEWEGLTVGMGTIEEGFYSYITFSSTWKGS